MFNNYPCNCRQYKQYRNVNDSTDELIWSTKIVEWVFLNYNDLQSIHLVGIHSEYTDQYTEILQYFALYFGITAQDHWQEKVLQLDCSACLHNSSYYYW